MHDPPFDQWPIYCLAHMLTDLAYDVDRFGCFAKSNRAVACMVWPLWPGAVDVERSALRRIRIIRSARSNSTAPEDSDPPDLAVEDPTHPEWSTLNEAQRPANLHRPAAFFRKA